MIFVVFIVVVFFFACVCFRGLRLRGASCAEVNWCSARLHVKTTLIGTWKPWTLLDTEVQWEVDWELLRGPGARSEARDWRGGSAPLTCSQQGGEQLFSSSGCGRGRGERGGGPCCLAARHVLAAALAFPTEGRCLFALFPFKLKPFQVRNVLLLK